MTKHKENARKIFEKAGMSGSFEESWENLGPNSSGVDFGDLFSSMFGANTTPKSTLGIRSNFGCFELYHRGTKRIIGIYGDLDRAKEQAIRLEALNTGN